jgi:hypothetical protein
VLKAVPFDWTALPCTKFVPVSVRVKAAPPSMREAGESEVRAGAGSVGPVAVTVTVTALDVETASLAPFYGVVSTRDGEAIKIVASISGIV